MWHFGALRPDPPRGGWRHSERDQGTRHKCLAVESMMGGLDRRLRRLEATQGGPEMTHEEWLDILEKKPGYELTREQRHRVRRSAEVHMIGWSG
jgi:hypothetical protein